MVRVPAIMIEDFCDFYSDMLGLCFVVCHDHCFLWYQSLMFCCCVCHKYRMSPLKPEHSQHSHCASRMVLSENSFRCGLEKIMTITL